MAEEAHGFVVVARSLRKILFSGSSFFSRARFLFFLENPVKALETTTSFTDSQIDTVLVKRSHYTYTMFKNKKTKQQSLSTVDNLLSTYLQTSDKKIVKSQKKMSKSHQASKLMDVNSKLGNFKKNLTDLKKHKRKERKIRNKESKKAADIKEKIIRQSKLEVGDKEIMSEIVGQKVKDLKKLEFVSNDDDVLDLQNEVMNLTSKQSTKKILKDMRDKKLLESRRRNAKENAFNEKISKGYISVGGLTPGLAAPGDDSDESSEEEDFGDNGNGNNLADFKDDFDDFN